MVSVEEQSKAEIYATSISANQSGIISSIIGVAGAGFRLSLILNAVSCEVANEGLEVHSISKAVTLFSLTLKQVGVSLQNADSVHTVEALDGVHKIAEDATDVFDEFNEMLDKVRAKPAEGRPIPSIHQRFQWCFRRHRVLYLLGHLDCLKMNASLIQQVLQLGKLMASTNKGDSQEEVQMKQELIRQERAETQNVLIVRYWQMSKMDRLWEASRVEDEDHKIAAIEQDDQDLALVSSNGGPAGGQLAIEAPPPEYSSSLALVKLPSYSLGELDQTLHQIKRSPKDMVQVSTDAIEPLLDRWTRWYEVREKRHSREAKNRYVPTVDNPQDDESDDGMKPYHRRYDDSRDNSPQAGSRGYYLEGSTTDWRQPHSAEARAAARRRRQQYRGFQPSVSADNSDGERDLESNFSTGSHTRKKAPRHHIIDSSSESEASDHEPQAQSRPRQRRGSESPKTERAHPVMQHAYSSPRVSSAGIGMSNMNAHPQAQGRPHPQHAYTAPGAGHLYPPINIANAHNPYANTGTPPPGQPQSAYQQPPPGYQQTPSQYPTYPSYPSVPAAHARYVPASASPAPPPAPIAQMQSQMQNMSLNPNRLSMPYTSSSQRPVSRDGPAPRSPSHQQQPPPLAARSGSYRDSYGYHDRHAQRPYSPAHSRDGRGQGQGQQQQVDEKGRPLGEGKPNAKKNLAEGATKGLLGAGAIAGFLEALEGLSI
ncbi:uncharacterized protein HMPREF1541_07146 [Cyphellophora europaea CBS 101466]|uniref:Uncharacterized protein n=1 Tax=Cyphellophora europaea (strain CBS 101466) TaxID=1220924 RepID=W2RP74_CYPE1|nr:uncharacterized protein HMPREF1541_07146 [Cyphellophora europaea CBS 101466]ETN37524.1 hypothetical protein HMPREF1541_07146 [Cyphellophora europaea CBS 101466]